MIIDTGFFIDLIQGDEGAIQKGKELEEDGTIQKISSATIFELFAGIERTDKPEEEKRLIQEVIDSKQVIEADQKIMKKAGKLHGKFINEGNRIPSFDTIIAATALKEEETLLTNDKDFKQIEGLKTGEY